ncbi:MAG: hypothetical protein AB1505_02395 [Candidatus Latescibacterota bacterium]
MTGWTDVSLQLRGGTVVLVLVPLLGLLAYLVYRRTNPPASPARRALLVTLRTSTFALLLMVLAEPVLRLWHRQIVRPLLIVLADTSGSMATVEQGGARLARVQSLLGSEEWREALARVQVQAWRFAEQATPVSLDTVTALRAGGTATDLGAALAAGLDRAFGAPGLRAVVVLSDGAHNLGEDPVRAAGRAGVPVYSLCVGSREPPPDVQIVEASAPEVSYVGQRLPVTAKVRSSGLAGRQVQVALLEGSRRLEQQVLQLGGGAHEQVVTFAFAPGTPGPHVYRVAVQAVPGETLLDNNEALVFAQVRQERVRALLLAGAPSVDLAFARRALQADSSMQLQTSVQRDGHALYGGTPLAQVAFDQQQVVALVDPGAQLLSGPVGERLRVRVEAGAGLLLVLGPTALAAWVPDGPVAALLPVQLRVPVSLVPTDMPVRLSPEGQHHPVLRLPAGAPDPWSQLPPLPGFVAVAQRRPGSTVLVEGAVAPRPPVVVVGTAGRGKVVVVLSAGLWRLDLLSSGAGGRPQTVREFWRNAARWLAIMQPAGRVRAYTERQIYRSGEPVVFTAQVYDELLRPQEGATVEVVPAGGGEAVPLAELGGGRYQGRWSGPPVGEHAFTASARIGGTQIGTDEGRFIVERYSVESVDVRANAALLSELARASGGHSRPLEEWKELMAALPLEQRVAEGEETLSVWGHLWPLTLAVVLLVGEWVLRRGSGMI